MKGRRCFVLFFFIPHPSSFILLLCSGRAGDGQCLADEVVETVESSRHVRAQINSYRAASARGERAEVAERLRLLQGAEGERLVGNGDVVRVRRGDLEEDAAGGPALVQLA